MVAGSLFAALLFALWASPVPQDLFDRAKSGAANGSAQGEVATTRDRLDLRFGAALTTLADERGRARIGIDSVIDADFACGRFDLRANLKSLLGKEAREDMIDALLGALEGELLHNALVLACEASPTACQAFQHFRVSANAILGMQYNRCQAIESAVSDGLRGLKAKAIKDCVEAKRREGMSMNEALASCENADMLQALDGSKVKEIDLAEELKKALKLDDVDFKNLQDLLSAVRLGANGSKGEVQADGVLRKFDALNGQYLAAWAEAVGALAADPQHRPTDEELKKLAPPGAGGGVLPDELRELAELPEAQRRIVLRVLASESALLHLTLDVQSIERKLAAARKDPRLDDGRVRAWTRELDDLRLQLRQIEERMERQARFSAAFLKARDLARTTQSRHAAAAVADSQGAAEDGKKLDAIAPAFGSRPGAPKKEKR